MHDTRNSEPKTSPDEGVKSVKKEATKSLTNQPALASICEGGGVFVGNEKRNNVLCENSGHHYQPWIVQSRPQTALKDDGNSEALP